MSDSKVILTIEIEDVGDVEDFINMLKNVGFDPVVKQIRIMNPEY